MLYVGRAAAEEVIELMDARGLDLRSHASRLLAPDLLTRSDLVLGMAREHVREAVLLQPALFTRAFTLKELIRRGAEIGPRASNETIPSWLGRAAEGRSPADFLGSAPMDDIADPMGRRFGVFKKTAVEIEALTGELVDLLWPVGR
jgi:protein-tyrosine phosphatase